MSYQSQQFASQILAQTEFSNLSKVTVEELEGNFQTSSGYRKFTLALKLNEKLFPTDPVKAEKYLLMARMLALEESDVFQRTMMQSVVYAQGINRCSKEILTRLATDPVETASILIRKHDTNQKQEAAFISTLLTPFIMEYSEVDLLGAVKVISQIPDSWIQADLTTAAIESSLARKSGIPVQK